MESLFKKYVEEAEGKYVLENDKGFVKYSFGEYEGKKHCYIEEIYMLRDFRQINMATEMADKVKDIAKGKGCVEIFGSVAVDIKNPTRSMRVLLGYGMSFSHLEPNIMFFKKEI